MSEEKNPRPQCGISSDVDEAVQNQEAEVSTSQAQIDYDKGKEFLGTGDAALAASAFHNALLGFEQEGDEGGIANASAQLGDICMSREDYDKAQKHFQRAFDICTKLDDPFSVISLKKKIAAVNRCMKKYDDAVEQYLDLVEMYEGYNNPAGVVAVLDEMADLYLEKGEKNKAADAYRTAASIHKNFSHSRHAEKLMDKASAIEAQG